MNFIAVIPQIGREIAQDLGINADPGTRAFRATKCAAKPKVAGKQGLRGAQLA